MNIWNRVNDVIVHGIMKVIMTEEYSDERLKSKMDYSIRVIWNEFEKFILMVIISLFMGCTKEWLLIFIIFSCLRIYMGGSHHNNGLNCFLHMMAVYVIILYLSDVIMMPRTVGVVVALILLILNWMTAPVSVKYRNFDRGKYKMVIRVKATVVIIIDMVLSILISYEYANIVMIAMSIQALDVCYAIIQTKEGER